MTSSVLYGLRGARPVGRHVPLSASAPARVAEATPDAPWRRALATVEDRAAAAYDALWRFLRDLRPDPRTDRIELRFERTEARRLRRSRPAGWSPGKVPVWQLCHDGVRDRGAERAVEAGGDRCRRLRTATTGSR